MSQPLCPRCQAEHTNSTRFCEQCGQPLYAGAMANRPITEEGDMPLLNRPALPGKVRIRLQDGKQFRLNAGSEFWVGRSDPAHSWYPQIDLAGHGGEKGGVSRRHGRLLLEDGRLFVEDCGSSNGTTLNRVQLTANQRYPVDSGDELVFGRLFARVKIDG